MDENTGFSRDERLHKRREYLEVLGRGDRVNSSAFVVYILNNDRPCHRLGITASRRIGKAVIRNRIKRRLRSIFRNNKMVIPVPCDVVINVRRSAVDRSYQELEREFLRTVDRWRGKRAGV